MKKTKTSSSIHLQSASQSKVQKKSPTTPVIKKKSKTITSSVNDIPFSSKSQPQDFIIINDNIYSANTSTQRNNYEYFLTSIKKEKQIQRKSFLVKSQITQNSLKKSRDVQKRKRKMFENISPQDLIQTMSLEQKKEMFYKLREEIQGQNHINIKNQHRNQYKANSYNLRDNFSYPAPLQNLSQRSKQQHNPSNEHQNLASQRQRQQKFTLIENKLQNLKMQLMFKWQGQIDKLQQLYAKKRINSEQKQTKIAMSEKIKDHKLKILDCTKTLFQKILRQEQYQKQTEQKSTKIQAILESLHSFPSLQSLQQNYLQKQPNIQHLKLRQKQQQLSLSAKKSPLQASPLLEITQQRNSHEMFLNEFTQNQYLNNDGSSRVKQFKRFQQSQNPMQSLSPQKRFAQFYQQNDSFMSQNQKKKHDSKGLINFNSSQKSSQIQEISSHQQVIKIDNLISAAPTDKILFKLDLRLDEVVFGQDQYPQCQKDDFKLQIPYQQKKDSQQQIIQNQQNNLNQHHLQTNQFGQIKENSNNILQSISSINQQKHTIPIVEQNNYSKLPLKPSQNQISSSISTNHEQQHHPNNQKPFVFSPKPQQKKFSLSTSPHHHLQNNLNQKPSLQLDDSLLCKQQIVVKQKININIPLILTRDKMQLLQFQKNKTFRQNLDKRIAFQMGCIQWNPCQQNQTNTSNDSPAKHSPQHIHFTTLVDINTYIIGFYQFMMKKSLNTLVDNLNIPYGKSVLDKIYSLQAEGFVLEESFNHMNNILSQEHFDQYQREMTLTVRKNSQFEITHNKAVFEAFNKCINVYRPYFELQGQVYPWLVSQKGITFYQITQQNIEQVFQKSKIKVLQYCTSLCGLLPPSQIKNQDQRQLIHLKTEQNLKKTINTQINQQFHDWNIRVVNYECLVRLSVAQRVYDQLLMEFMKDMRNMQQQIQARNQESQQIQ